MREDTFTLRINLGNAACNDRRDIADVLERIKLKVVRTDAKGGPVQDLNGNSIGSWRFTKER